MSTRRSLARLVLVAAGAVAATAQAPRPYAITGARIVTASGADIERGTVVVRGDRIEAAGASATTPDGAEVIDGHGLTVYPGLIDLGYTGFTPPGWSETPREARTVDAQQAWKRDQMLHPSLRATNACKIDPAGLARLAGAGVTTVLMIPPGEIVAGQSALVDLTSTMPDQPGGFATRVVRPDVALHIGFPIRPSGNAYPASAMGVIAFVRQAFLDAEHDRVAKAATPNGLAPALERVQPVVMRATLAREIRRELAMAAQFKLRPIIAGGHEAARTIDDLRAADAPVIYSLNYPVRTVSLAPDADEPLRLMRLRADAPKGPAALAKAGVRFAFESAGLADPAVFLRNAAAAVREGLPRDAAIRALTIDAARIAGVADRLGSIDAGKLANLVVTDGDLFEARTRVVRVFVEGQPVHPKVPGP